MPSYAEALARECERMCEADIGYDQSNRWGDNECDCSSLVYRCVYAIDPGTRLNRADPRYTGTLLRDLLAIGFREVPKSSHRRGDVLLNSANHVLVDLGGGRVGGARIDEHGRASGGQGGDQTGKEVCVHDYYDYPWNHVLRPPDVEIGDDMTDEQAAQLKFIYDHMHWDEQTHFSGLGNLVAEQPVKYADRDEAASIGERLRYIDAHTHEVDQKLDRILELLGK